MIRMLFDRVPEPVITFLCVFGIGSYVIGSISLLVWLLVTGMPILAAFTTCFIVALGVAVAEWIADY